MVVSLYYVWVLILPTVEEKMEGNPEYQSEFEIVWEYIEKAGLFWGTYSLCSLRF